ERLLIYGFLQPFSEFFPYSKNLSKILSRAKIIYQTIAQFDFFSYELEDVKLRLEKIKQDREDKVYSFFILSNNLENTDLFTNSNSEEVAQNPLPLKDNEFVLYGVDSITDEEFENPKWDFFIKKSLESFRTYYYHVSILQNGKLKCYEN